MMVRRMTSKPTTFNIAGLAIELVEPALVLDELQALYRDFDQRTDTFKADERNPHLCAAGCSHCCKRGAVFAVTLAEAVLWSQAICTLPRVTRQQALKSASALLIEQQRIFATVEDGLDVPGQRSEPVFSARISALNAALGPTCPLLMNDLCSVYEGRPLLCRAYGFPVDAYAVKGDSTIVFRSLCVLYENEGLVDFVRAEDLRAQLMQLSKRLAGGREVGRFTSVEVVLASRSEHA